MSRPKGREHDALPEAATETAAAEAQTENLLPRDLPAPAEMADTLRARPDRQQMLLQLQSTAGNSYVQQVVQAMQAGPKTQQEPNAERGEGQTSGAPQAGSIPVTVRIPPGATHDEIRETILRGSVFRFGDADLELFARSIQANPSFFFLEDSRHPGGPATPAMMQSWCDPKTRLAVIPLHQDRVDAIRALKTKRGSQVIDAILDSSALALDPKLQETLKPLLADLLGPTGDRRNSAATTLMNLTSGDVATAKTMAAVLGALDQAGMGNDSLIPALRGLANARAAAVPRDFIGPVTGPVLDKERAITAESDAKSAKDGLKLQREQGTIDRNEASLIYDITSRTYEATGNSNAQRKDEMTARFFTVDDKERSAPGMGVPVVKPGTRSMQAPSSTDLEIRDIRAEREALLAEWAAMEDQTKVPETPPMLEDKTTTTRLEGGKKHGRLMAQRDDSKMAGANAMALASTYLKWRAAGLRVEVMARLRDREDNLTRKSWHENNYPVPPQPEELEVLAKHLDRNAARGGPQAATARQRASEVRDFIETSRAYYALP